MTALTAPTGIPVGAAGRRRGSVPGARPGLCGSLRTVAAREPGLARSAPLGLVGGPPSLRDLHPPRVARPTSAFWEAWRQRKEEMKRFGVQVYQTEWALRQRYPVADSQLPYSVSWTEKMLTPVLQPEEAAVDPVSAPLGASGAAQPEPEPWHTWYSLALDISRALGRIQFKAAPTPLWRTCYPHQQSAVEFSLRRWATGRRGAIIGLEQGLGKTLTTLACLRADAVARGSPLAGLAGGPGPHQRGVGAGHSSLPVGAEFLSGTVAPRNQPAVSRCGCSPADPCQL